MSANDDLSTELAESLLGSLGRGQLSPPDLARALAHAPARVGELEPDALLRELRLRLGREHQFSELDSAAAAALAALFERSVARLRGLASAGAHAELAALLVEHRAELERALGGKLGGARAISRQYTPSLQLAVLGLEPDSIRDPVLDVGCGSRAALVRFLRAEAHDAHGIDRDAPKDVATAADWLEFDYGTERWGTVLSHLGFSLHFLHHHLKGDELVAAYGNAYLRILRSLRAQGSFAYVPSLPFVEAHLPRERFVVTRSTLGGPLSAALAAARQETGLDLGSATRVRRVG